MSLRRFAQTNHAGAQATSPRSSDGSVGSSPSTPMKAKGTPPTPRTRLIYPHSPLTSPSLSASTPFDWEAARLRKPPPYGTPLAGKRARAARKSSDTAPAAPKRVIRRKGIVERNQVVVVVLGDLSGWCVTGRTEVSPDTSAGGVDVEGRLAGDLVAPLRASEECRCTGEIEDVGLRVH